MPSDEPKMQECGRHTIVEDAIGRVFSSLFAHIKCIPRRDEGLNRRSQGKAVLGIADRERVLPAVPERFEHGFCCRALAHALEREFKNGRAELGDLKPFKDLGEHGFKSPRTPLEQNLQTRCSSAATRRHSTVHASRLYPSEQGFSDRG